MTEKIATVYPTNAGNKSFSFNIMDNSNSIALGVEMTLVDLKSSETYTINCIIKNNYNNVILGNNIKIKVDSSDKGSYQVLPNDTFGTTVSFNANVSLESFNNEAGCMYLELINSTGEIMHTNETYFYLQTLTTND